MPLLLPKPYSILLDFAAWALVHAVAGYLVHRLPPSRFARDTFVTRARRFEGDGEIYQRFFRIKKWKAMLPEAGAAFRGGFDKKRLAGGSDAALERYMQETRRAEVAHWGTAAVAPLFFAWNPVRPGVVMLLYAVVVNVPCIMALRYNRLRLARIIRRRESARGRSAGGSTKARPPTP